MEKQRNGEVGNYDDKNTKGRNEAYYCKSLSEVKNKVLVENALITSWEQILLWKEPAIFLTSLNFCEKMTVLTLLLSLKGYHDY